MMLLPLHSLLNVPVSSLTIVEDNAKSPLESLTIKKNKENQRRRRRHVKRAISWDGVNARNRWSTSMPVAPSAPRASEEPCASQSSFFRASALELRGETNASAPLKKPVRQTSPPTSPDTNSMGERKHMAVASNVSIETKSSADDLGRVQVESRFVGQDKLSPFQSSKDCISSRPLKIPIRHQSPKVSIRKAFQKKQETLSPPSHGTSTMDILQEALDRLQQMDS